MPSSVPPAESHLLQMRGLKRELLLPYRDKSKSHLLQMRGLKHRRDEASRQRSQVASFTDAWIETW